jgi:hypothetical protein
VDISRGGILLETLTPIESGLILLTAVDLDDNLIDIKGELVHSRNTATGMYHAGIKFVDTNEQRANFAARLIKEYNHRLNKVHNSLAL